MGDRMNFAELVRRRQSCRSFDSSRPAEPEAVDLCLKAARMAPSAVNAQPYTMWLVTDGLAAKVADSCAESAPFLRDCSTIVVFTEESYNFGETVGAFLNNQDFRSIDIGIAASYLTAMATEAGLDSCIVGAFDPKAVAKIIGSKEKPRIMVALGHATEGYALREKKRKDFDVLVKRVSAAPAETEKPKKQKKPRSEKPKKQKKQKPSKKVPAEDPEGLPRDGERSFCPSACLRRASAGWLSSSSTRSSSSSPTATGRYPSAAGTTPRSYRRPSTCSTPPAGRSSSSCTTGTRTALRRGTPPSRP